jgi:adenylylsulfate kinase
LQHIHPIFDTILSRQHKENLLEQKAVVLWMLGLSGSGKSTLAREVEQHLHAQGYLTQLLDGDNLRTGINNNLGFSEADRLENIRRAAETAKLFLNCGIITICSFISPTRQIRDMAREIIGEPDFLEVYINCPIEECERRDVKGLYAKARRGEIKQFTGIDAPFEEPLSPFIEIQTDKQALSVSTQQLLSAILPRIVQSRQQQNKE